ncbi:hypothetical protein [Nostoc punctiforme]|nr:hypothetical protein [Nostoc punctiforme]
MFHDKVQHIVFQRRFMRVRKKEIDDFVSEKIIYSPTNEYRHCLHIFAAIGKELISIYALKSCKKQIAGLSPLHFKIKQSIGKRENPVTIYIDRELDELLKKFEGIPRSHVLERCLILEVDERISKWRCETPLQFIGLMSSETPLKDLKGEVSLGNESPAPIGRGNKYAQVAA